VNAWHRRYRSHPGNIFKASHFDATSSDTGHHDSRSSSHMPLRWGLTPREGLKFDYDFMQVVRGFVGRSSHKGADSFSSGVSPPNLWISEETGRRACWPLVRGLPSDKAVRHGACRSCVPPQTTSGSKWLGYRLNLVPLAWSRSPIPAPPVASGLNATACEMNYTKSWYPVSLKVAPKWDALNRCCLGRPNNCCLEDPCPWFVSHTRLECKISRKYCGTLRTRTPGGNPPTIAETRRLWTFPSFIHTCASMIEGTFWFWSRTLFAHTAIGIPPAPKSAASASHWSSSSKLPRFATS